MIYRILIVDDEPPSLKNLQKNISNVKNLDIEIVDVAYNGLEALEKFKLLKPDVIFTDIKMPVMDGLELIKEIKKINKETLFVILSAYQEFDLVREALKIGVEDYLLKPVGFEALESIMKNIIDKLNIFTYESTKLYINSALKGNLISGMGKIQYHSGYYLSLLNAGPYPFCSSINKYSYDGYWKAININLDSPSKLKYWIFKGEYDRQLVIVWGSDCPGKEHTIQISLSKMLSENNGNSVSVTSATSPYINDIRELYANYQQLKEFLHKETIPGVSKHTISKTNTMKTISSVISSSTEKKLLLALNNSDFELFSKEIKLIFNRFYTELKLQILIEQFVDYILYIFNKTLPNISTEVYYFLKKNLNEIILSQNNYDIVLKKIQNEIDKFLKDHAISLNNRNSSINIVYKVSEYIKNYYMEEINVNTLSKKYKISTSYLCVLFKKHFNISPNEYLIQVRINQAKALIEEFPDMLLKDISELVGYTDQHYFSRIFKSKTGFSPSEYKSFTKSPHAPG